MLKILSPLKAIWKNLSLSDISLIVSGIASLATSIRGYIEIDVLYQPILLVGQGINWSVAVFLILLLAPLFFFLWFIFLKIYLHRRRNRKYVLIFVDDFYWKYTIQTDTVENHPLCPIHKTNMVPMGDKIICPKEKCKTSHPYQNYVEQWMINARAKAKSLAIAELDGR